MEDNVHVASCQQGVGVKLHDRCTQIVLQLYYMAPLGRIINSFLKHVIVDVIVSAVEPA